MHMEDPAEEDPTWITEAAPIRSERPEWPMQRAAKRFAEQPCRRGKIVHHRPSRRRWRASPKRSRLKLSNGELTRASRAEGRYRLVRPIAVWPTLRGPPTSCSSTADAARDPSPRRQCHALRPP